MAQNYNTEYVEKFLKGEITYDEYIKDGGADSKLWQDFLFTMFTIGVLRKNPYDQSEIGGKIDKYSDLDGYNNDPTNANDEWENSKFFYNNQVETVWNESIDDIRKHFAEFYKSYIQAGYPQADKYDIREKIIARLKNSDAGFDFSGEPWVKPETNIDDNTYSQVRGLDKILSVLDSNENLQFTSEQHDEDFIVRLIMPKYSRRVEIEDLNRNFWVISQALGSVIKLVVENDSPLILLMRDLIKETTEAWQNIYYLWAALAAIEDKLENLENDIKKIETGSQKTPLNIHLHFPVNNNIPAQESWLRLFPVSSDNGVNLTLYDIRDEIETFKLVDIYYFGTPNIPSWINNDRVIIEDLYNYNWLKQNGSLIYQPGKKYYPAYNGQGIKMPGTEKFFLRDDIDDIINSPYPVEIIKEEDLIYGIEAPKLGAIAKAKITYKNDEEVARPVISYAAFDIGHPFVNTHNLSLDKEDSEATTRLKVQEVNKAIWDTLAYADYDPQGKTVELVQNKILFENLPWEEEILDNGIVKVQTTDDICLDHKVNSFANLVYERSKNSADKRDMAQIIRDVAAFNYVYRFKNNSSPVNSIVIWDFMPYEMGIRPDAKQYFIDFLYYLADMPTDSFDSITLTGEAIQNVRGGIPRILEVLEVPRSGKYSNFDYLLDSPKMAGVASAYHAYKKSSSNRKLDYFLETIKETYKLFGFDYDLIWESLEEDVTISGEDSDYSNIINQNFVHIFVQEFGNLIGKDLSYTTDAKKREFRNEINNYINDTLAQGWLYKYQKFSPNPFLSMKPVYSWNQTYSMDDNCRFNDYKQQYSFTSEENPVLIEIIATGTDNALPCFVNDYYKQRDGLTPTIDDMRSGAEEVGFWDEVCVPMVNRSMVYKKQDGTKGPSIELKATIPHDMSTYITSNTYNSTHMYDAMIEHGVVSGFSILAADQYPQVKNDYLSAYIQVDFGEVSNYDFRFVDNPASYQGDYQNNIINYTIRQIKTNNITNSANPTNHMNCHNCSLNIPYDLSYTRYEDNRLTDIFSVGVPVASATNFSLLETRLKNVYQINHDKGYIYRMINNDNENLGIADGILGIHSAVIDKDSDTTQTQSPYMTDIPKIDNPQQEKFRYAFESNAQKDWLLSQLEEKELTWFDAFTEFFPSDYRQTYINADNPENFIEADKSFVSTNILSPTLAYSGERGGTINLMDMYISTSLPSLPYYRVEKPVNHGDSYKGFTTFGVDNINPLENYHQTTSRQDIYNQEYTNFNDIYIRDLLPRKEQQKKPKLYADISVFSDLNTVFEIKFLKDEHKIKFPGLSKTTSVSINDSFSNGNFNFIKIGNFAYSNGSITTESKLENLSNQVDKDNISYTSVGGEHQKTSYIYNFKYRKYKNGQEDTSTTFHEDETLGDANEKNSNLSLFHIDEDKITFNTLQNYSENDIVTAGFEVIQHFIIKDCDPYYTFSEDERLNQINYFITGIGRQPIAYTNSDQTYWSSSTLCHGFVTIPSKIYLKEYEMEVEIPEEEIGRIFANNKTKVVKVNENKNLYIICLNNLNLTEGYFIFQSPNEDGQQEILTINRSVYYKDENNATYKTNWRGPYISLLNTENQIKVTLDLTKTEFSGGENIQVKNVKLVVPESIDITCGMYDYRLRQVKADEGKILTPDQYTVIKGDYKFYLNNSNESEIFVGYDNFHFFDRSKGGIGSINGTEKLDINTATLGNVFGESDVPSSIKDISITRAIFTDGRILNYTK